MNIDETEKSNDRYRKAVSLCKMLDIPLSLGCICVEDLYDILIDEEKLKKLVSTVKLKAFL
jgi:hypothetical protein